MISGSCHHPGERFGVVVSPFGCPLGLGNPGVPQQLPAYPASRGQEVEVPAPSWSAPLCDALQKGSWSKSCRHRCSGAPAADAAQKQPCCSHKSAPRDGCSSGHHSLLQFILAVPRDGHTQKICQFGGSPGEGLLLGQVLGLINQMG